jgi:hypothetical protein
MSSWPSGAVRPCAQLSAAPQSRLSPALLCLSEPSGRGDAMLLTAWPNDAVLRTKMPSEAGMAWRSRTWRTGRGPAGEAMRSSRSVVRYCYSTPRRAGYAWLGRARRGPAKQAWHGIASGQCVAWSIPANRSTAGPAQRGLSSPCAPWRAQQCYAQPSRQSRATLGSTSQTAAKRAGNKKGSGPRPAPTVFKGGTNL